MNGVFINMTEDDIVITLDDDKRVTIPGNKDLVTPIKQRIKTDNALSGIVSTPLTDTDIHNLLATKWINSTYTKIERAEQEVIITVPLISPYVKYPFTKEQIEKINNISNGRTRLLLLTKEDAEYWSGGEFDCPFRNYRLFISEGESLLEYPIPKTYLDLVVSSVKGLMR